MIDTLACHLCFLTVLLTEGLGLGDSFLQRRDVGLQSLERTAFVRVFVRVFVRAPTRRVGGFLGFKVDKDPSLAVVAPLPLPACTDSLLARGFRRDSESLGKLAVRQPSFSHRHLSIQGSFACTAARLTSGYHAW